ncbi:MAG: hypothetical protein GY715_16600 [Planctomycetes bacterium]|nr:hypothetical protein [Planctomycetota bacterium]
MSALFLAPREALAISGGAFADVAFVDGVVTVLPAPPVLALALIAVVARRRRRRG